MLSQLPDNRRKWPTHRVSLLRCIEWHGFVEAGEHLFDHLDVLGLNKHHRQFSRFERLEERRACSAEFDVRLASDAQFLVFEKFEILRQGKLTIHERPQSLETLLAVNDGIARSQSWLM